ncbi:hypothetical protein OIU76_022956 [Salix suchowensis]|nr:hypothetical protein OIU76_022956 [Salix suchowensis]
MERTSLIGKGISRIILESEGRENVPSYSPVPIVTNTSSDEEKATSNSSKVRGITRNLPHACRNGASICKRGLSILMLILS